MPASNPLYISAIHLDETDQKVFQVALQLLEDEGIHCEVLPAGNDRGHLVVIDMLAPESEGLLPSLRPGQVKLVLGDTHRTGANLVSVIKPIRVGTFSDVLRKVCKKMYSQLGNPLPARTDVVAEKEIQYAGIPAFMQQIMQISEKKKSCVIHLGNRHDLMIDGERQMLLGRESLDAIISMPLSVFGQAEIEIIPGKAAQVDTGSSSMSALPGFLWELAVRIPESILPADLNQETKISLKAWPNFTRHGFRPEHLKIAALLAKQAVSIKSIAEHTSLEPALVQQFVNGCYVVGLLSLSNGIPDKAPDKKANRQVSKEKKTLFKRLANKLGFA